MRLSLARGDVGVGLDEPVGPRDVAIAATRMHAFLVAAVHRVLVVGIVRLQHHGVAGQVVKALLSLPVDHGTFTTPCRRRKQRRRLIGQPTASD